MKTNLFIICTILSVCLTGCKEEQKFPLDKKYWDVKDYENVVNEIKYNSKPGEKLPTFDNPDTKLLLEKLTDENNFKVVLDDKELGIKHKSEVSQEFFDKWKVMSDIYTEIDRTDKYVYEKELVEIWNFGLELQIKYFKLGNDAIIEKSDDPNSIEVKDVVDSNTNTLVNNMIIFLDEINNEKSYSNVGLDLISTGIDKNFTELINVYPNFNYDNLLDKVNLMLNKTKSESIKQSLSKLKQLIESKKK
ncbi:hypothetical protein B0A56_03255 [Flavobacterium columnare NBRC 100251 = ATCC 23463]|nr:hypothetical protein B0A56_03255 [Flavobacterium columnare NBRC 100251 = ATCC 23463]